MSGGVVVLFESDIPVGIVPSANFKSKTNAAFPVLFGGWLDRQAGDCDQMGKPTIP